MSDQYTAKRQNAPTADSRQREELAEYFLSVPPYSEQSDTERVTFLDKLRQLGQLENREVLQSAGSHRPLVWDNPVPLLQNILTAAQRLAAGQGQTLLLFPAADTSIRFQAMMHPRLLTLATANLLAVACAAAPHDPVWVRLQEQEHCLTVSATAAAPITDVTALAVIQECARLHNGSLAQCDNSVAFSCSRVEAPPQEVRHYVCPTADELCRDTLSPLWTVFYSSISSSDNISEGSPSSESDTSAPSSDEDGASISTTEESE